MKLNQAFGLGLIWVAARDMIYKRPDWKTLLFSLLMVFVGVCFLLTGCRPHPQPYRACLNEPGYQVVGPGKKSAKYNGCGDLLWVDDCDKDNCGKEAR